MSSHLKMVRARSMKFVQYMCRYVSYLQAKYKCLKINSSFKNKLLLKKLRNFFSVNTYFLFFMKFCSDVLQMCTNEPEKNSWCIFALRFFYRFLKFRAACLCSSRPWPPPETNTPPNLNPLRASHGAYGAAMDGLLQF